MALTPACVYRPVALKDWKPCANCGEKYGKMALPKHLTRCLQMRPDGPAARRRMAEMRMQVAEENEARLRALFDRFDTDEDQKLSPEELGTLLRQCFPGRCLDAEELAATFAAADQDGDGEISFDEFIQMHNMMAGPSTKFDSASDMFHFFDTDHSGYLDHGEFTKLLNQCFPAHCEENEVCQRAGSCRSRKKRQEAAGNGRNRIGVRLHAAHPMLSFPHPPPRKSVGAWRILSRCWSRCIYIFSL